MSNFRKQLAKRREPFVNIPRPMYDKREIVVNSLAEIASWTPPPFDLAKLWHRPGNPRVVEPDKLLVFYGKRRTGKTFAARAILKHGRQFFPAGLVMTKTAFNGQWGAHFPRKYIHEPDPVVVDLLIQQQIKEITRAKEYGIEDRVNLWKVLVLDDVVDQKFRYFSEILDLATRARHFKICVLLLTQYAKLVAAGVRVNTDYNFILFQKTPRERRIVAEELIPGLPLGHAGEVIANNILDRYTQAPEENPQRTILVTDGIKNVSGFKDNLYLWEPQDPGEFRVGCPEFWREEF